jgi:DNA-directed RNA polymerase subunit E'/Rpb7
MHPTTFGPKLHEEIQRRLRKEVEGSVDGRYGFIITIVSTDHLPLGQIQEGKLRIW